VAGVCDPGAIEKPASERPATEYNLRNVFDTHPNNTFLVKVSYWLNP
jgi:hypothetical protein